MALLEVNRDRGSDAGVSQWAFDSAIGRISGRDTYGNLVMAFSIDPLFGPRLAAAFNAPAMQQWPAHGPVGIRADRLDGMKRIQTLATQ